MEEALMPDLDKGVYKTIRQVRESRPKSEGEKRAEALAALIGYGGWEGGLKPYLKERIETLKAMSEVKFDGTETLLEIGTKYSLSSVIADELQSLLDLVEVNYKVIEDLEKRKKVKK